MPQLSLASSKSRLNEVGHLTMIAIIIIIIIVIIIILYIIIIIIIITSY